MTGRSARAVADSRNASHGNEPSYFRPSAFPSPAGTAPSLSTRGPGRSAWQREWLASPAAWGNTQAPIGSTGQCVNPHQRLRTNPLSPRLHTTCTDSSSTDKRKLAAAAPPIEVAVAGPRSPHAGVHDRETH